MGTTPHAPSDPHRTLGLIRFALLAVLLLGLFGTGVELVLLEHTEELVQWIPIGLIALALVLIIWHLVSKSAASVRALQATMILFIVAGIVGTVLHFKGNVEFELEMYPNLGGFALVREAMMGATPALSPGVMVQLGLIGLLYVYRHPALAR